MPRIVPAAGRGIAAEWRLAARRSAVGAALNSGSCPEDPMSKRFALSTLALALSLALAACQQAEAPKPAAAAPAAKPAAVAPAAPAFAHVENFDESLAKAKAEGKAVLVDAWAPWCHTCLSMQNYVLNDPSLASLGERVVLVELDTDKPENAAFLEKYTVNVWPTFFVIDANSGEATSLWPGSASVNEFRGFVEDGLAG